MKPTPKVLVLLLLVCAHQNVFSDAATLEAFPKGLGVNAGLTSGVGLSYRELTLKGGWQVTGIVFKETSYDGRGPLDFSFGTGRLFPLGAFAPVSWLNVVPYLQLAASVNGRWGWEARWKSVSTTLGVSGGYGLEWLFWDHFSVNVEVAQSAGTMLTPGSDDAPQFSYFSMVLPQLALYFRY